MGDQRPMFRFRFPGMIPSAADQGPEVVTRRPSTQAPTATAEAQTPAPAQRQPFRFASVATMQPPPPQAQTITTTQTQAPAIQAPSSAQSIASTSTTPIPPLMLPSTSLRQVSVQGPVAQVGSLTTIKAQPSSPSGGRPQFQAAFQPSSPARVSPHAQTTFEPSSLALSEPPKSPQTNQAQPLSPSQTTEQTSPPSLPATNAQPSGGTGTRPTSPSKMSDPLRSSQPPTSSSKALSPVFQKEQNLAMPQPLSLEAQPKIASITHGPISTSPFKAITQPTVDVVHPSTQSEHTEAITPTPVVAKEIPLPTTKSDDYPKPHTKLDGYHVKTKKKETEHATAKAHVESGLMAHHKDQPKVAYQAVEKQEMVYEKEVPKLNTAVEKQEMVYEKEVPKLNTAQTKSTGSHQKDKSTSSGSHHPKVSNGEHVSLQQELRNDIFKLVRKISTAYPEHPMQEKPTTMISLVGENTGASMQLGSETAERAAVYNHRGHKINPNERANATTEQEESSKGRRSKDTSINIINKVTKTYINNNIQHCNNSIVLNASINERNPGIRLAFFHYPTEPIKSNNITKSHEIHKAEVSITPPEKLTYTPTIFCMEPSDSEPDDLNAYTGINVV